MFLFDQIYLDRTTELCNHLSQLSRWIITTRVHRWTLIFIWR